MPGDRQLFPESTPLAAQADAQPSAVAATNPARVVPRLAPVWLQRLSLVVLVLFCVYLGILVMVLPWWPRIWDQNAWIQARPALAAILHNGAVRGIISGLGVLDIWIGLSEAVHYRDVRGQA